MEQKILDMLEKIQIDIDALKKEVKEIDYKASATIEQNGGTIFHSDTLERMEKEINEIKKVTIRNCYDITYLKSIK